MEASPQYREGLFTATSVGFFLLLVGTIFVITPNLFDRILDLLRDFELVDVPHTDLIFPGPAFPSRHSIVYLAAEQFSFAVGLFQIIILALRFLVSSSEGKKAEAVGNLVFWGGAGFLIQFFLIETTQWFVFWSVVIMLIGASLIARAIIIAVARI